MKATMIKLRTIIRLAALPLLCLPLLGCKSTVNTVRVNEDGRYDWIQTDSELSEIAQIQHVSKSRVDGLLRVSVEILNTRDKQKTIQYRFSWVDQDNMPLPSSMSTWKRAILEGQQSLLLSGIAPDTRATDCRLEMIRAN
jgi:uncharacterized protein YcfL